MTCREKLKMEHPESVSDLHTENKDDICRKCWDREIPNSEPEPNSQLDIYALINDTMQKRDRTVAIYIHPENGMSVNIYPWPDMDDLWKLYKNGRITANDFRVKMNLPMVKNAEKFMRRSREE